MSGNNEQEGIFVSWLMNSRPIPWVHPVFVCVCVRLCVLMSVCARKGEGRKRGRKRGRMKERERAYQSQERFYFEKKN